MTDWKKTLRPYADLLEQLHQKVKTDAAEMSDADLKALNEAALKPSSTNCGWSTFEAAAIVRERAGHELWMRKHREPAHD